MGTDAPTIADFVSGLDHLELSAAMFQGGQVDHSLDPNAFVSSSTGKAMDADDRFLYNSTKGTLSYDDDGTGAHAAVLIATLSAHPLLTAHDFTFG